MYVHKTEALAGLWPALCSKMAKTQQKATTTHQEHQKKISEHLLHTTPWIKKCGVNRVAPSGQSFHNMRCKSLLKVAEHLVAGFFQEASSGTSLQNMLARLVGPSVENMLSMLAAMRMNSNAPDKKTKIKRRQRAAAARLVGRLVGRPCMAAGRP